MTHDQGFALLKVSKMSHHRQRPVTGDETAKLNRWQSRRTNPGCVDDHCDGKPIRKRSKCCLREALSRIGCHRVVELRTKPDRHAPDTDPTIRKNPLPSDGPERHHVEWYSLAVVILSSFRIGFVNLRSASHNALFLGKGVVNVVPTCRKTIESDIVIFYHGSITGHPGSLHQGRTCNTSALIIW